MLHVHAIATRSVQLAGWMQARYEEHFTDFGIQRKMRFEKTLRFKGEDTVSVPGSSAFQNLPQTLKFHNDAY
jgi:hypothetical protein